MRQVKKGDTFKKGDGMEEIIKELEWILDCEEDRIRDGEYLCLAEMEEQMGQNIKDIRHTLEKLKKEIES